MKLKKIKLFSFFNFFANVDITDDTQVLRRRNEVIKNIVFVTNLFYSLILTVLSFLNTNITNYIMTGFMFLLTFVVNKALKDLIRKNGSDYTKQEVAMFFFSFYLFFLSIFVYWRISTGAPEFANTGYLLLLYAVVVVTLYQNKHLFRTIAPFIFVLFLFCHLFITYRIFDQPYTSNLGEMLRAIVNESDLQDLIFRTIITSLFIFVNWQIVAIGEHLHKKRKEELIKRKNIETDFLSVVKEIYNIVLNSNYTFQDHRRYASLVTDMTKKFTSYLDMPLLESEKLCEFSGIHIKHKDILKLDETISGSINETEFQALKAKTEIGLSVVRRFQLAQKSNDIVFMMTYGTTNEEYKDNIIRIYKNKPEEIILLCETYISLRSDKKYKRPLNNQHAVIALREHLNAYFDRQTLEKFLKNIETFTEMFDNFTG
ncbi:MAG: hypothetical protein FWE36_00690 [Erysipelotrichales bacterium]|nr:hypothetical protein [Erysipelotrichales bacterium]